MMNWVLSAFFCQFMFRDLGKLSSNSFDTEFFLNFFFAGSHFCDRCRKTSQFRCLCCPSAVCGKCIYFGEFAIVKGKKGFCRHCSKLAFLIEGNADVDSDGVRLFSILCHMQQEKKYKFVNLTTKKITTFCLFIIYVCWQIEIFWPKLPILVGRVVLWMIRKETWNTISNRFFPVLFLNGENCFEKNLQELNE